MFDPQTRCIALEYTSDCKVGSIRFSDLDINEFLEFLVDLYTTLKPDALIEMIRVSTGHSISITTETHTQYVNVFVCSRDTIQNMLTLVSPNMGKFAL